MAKIVDCINYELSKELEEYLIESGILHLARVRINQFRFWNKYTHTTCYHSIAGCFAWDETPEGLKFWSNISHKMESKTKEKQ